MAGSTVTRWAAPSELATWRSEPGPCQPGLQGSDAAQPRITCSQKFAPGFDAITAFGMLSPDGLWSWPSSTSVVASCAAKSGASGRTEIESRSA